VIPPRGKAKAELESHAAGKTGGAHVATKGREDKKPALPRKDGQVDQALYETFPPKSLRRRLWDAIAENKCPRCSGPHLRIACPEPRQAWEDDFEKDGFFTKPPPAARAQARVQLSGDWRHVTHPRILSVMNPLGRCLIDTCSDVSVARRDVLVDPHFFDEPVIVGHLGGKTTLLEAGTLGFERSDGSGTITLAGVCIVEPNMLPAGIVALLGVGDIQRLGMSLDTIMAVPDCF
jgi:hypothetical protein